MARIDLFSDVYQKSMNIQSQEFQQERDMLISKYSQIADSLRKENTDLRHQIEQKDQTINMMSVEFNPAKKNLLVKIGLLCDKLKIASAADYEAWIEEVEVSRIRSRFNEESIISLEKALKEHKEKVLGLENQLRAFGVNLKDGQTTPFNINDRLQSTYKICEDLNYKLILSENTIEMIEDIIGVQENQRKELVKKRNESAKERRYSALSLQESIVCIEKNFEEIAKKISLIEDHEKIKQEMVRKLVNFQLKDIQKSCEHNLNETLRLSKFLLSAKKESSNYAARINQITSQKFQNENQGALMEKIAKSCNLQDSLIAIQKNILILSPNDSNSYFVQELTESILNFISSSEKTIESFMKYDGSLSGEYQRLISHRKSLITNLNLDPKSTVANISSLLDLLSQHDNLKAQIYSQPKLLLGSEKFSTLPLYKKLEIETPILRSLCELAKIPTDISIPHPSLPLLELIVFDEGRLELYKSCFLKFRDFGSVKVDLQDFSEYLSEIAVLLQRFTELLTPGNGSIHAEQLELIDQVGNIQGILRNPQVTGVSLSAGAECIRISLGLVHSLLNSLVRELPEPMPALQELEHLSSLLKSSNLTVETLAKAFGKEEQYTRLVEIEGIPQIETPVERDFSTRWAWMHRFIQRVSEVGLHLESVKRTIIEDIAGSYKGDMEKLGEGRGKDTESDLEMKVRLQKAVDDLNRLKKQSADDMDRVQKQKTDEIGRLQKASANDISRLQKQIQDLSDEFAELTRKNTTLADQLSESSDKNKHYEDNLEQIWKKIGEILVKTDFVGDTLMEILPENSLKGKMDKFQSQFEDLINQGSAPDGISTDSIHELLGLLDRYESANGVQASRLAGVSQKFAEEDVESLGKSAKGKMNMKAKQTLRSGRPAAVPPMNSMKESLAIVAENTENSLKSYGENPHLTEITEESTEYWEEISKSTVKLRKIVTFNWESMIDLEGDREKLVLQQIDIFSSVAGDGLKQEISIIKEAIEKARAIKTDSISELIAKSRTKFELEKQVCRIRIELGFKENHENITGDLDDLYHEVIKESLATSKLLSASSEAISKVREDSKHITISGIPTEIIGKLPGALKLLIEIEKDKQILLGAGDFSRILSDFLAKFQVLAKQNAENLQILWNLLLKLIGKDSDRLLLKGFAFTLPQPSSDIIPVVLPIMQESLSLFEAFISKNQAKVNEFAERQGEIAATAGDVEENLDDLLRKNLKEFVSIEEEAVKKQVSVIKEDFEEISEKICNTFYEKFDHLASGLAMFTKIDNIKRRIFDNAQKAVRKIENELLAKNNEIETLAAGAENEKKALKNMLDLSDAHLKETKAQFDKLSKDNYDKQLETTSLANTKNDLLAKIEEKDSEISRLQDEISDQKSSLRTSRNNLKEKSDEITRLEDKIRENKSSLFRPVIDDSILANLRTDVLRLNEAIYNKDKEIESKIDDFMMCKRDKEMLNREVSGLNETIKSLREELGHLKARNLHVESDYKELEEKNHLGVDRNDTEITLLIQKLEMQTNESKQMRLQLEPSMNYRKLYTEIKTELELVQQDRQDYNFEIKNLILKLKVLSTENETLKYENRMMEQYKKEWLTTKDTCDILSKKLDYFKEGIEKSEDLKVAIDKFTQDMQKSLENLHILQEKSENLEAELKDSRQLIETIRKKQVFFKVLMIGRIKSYYRFTKWLNTIKSPSNFENEDVDLVQTYTAYVLAKVPSTVSEEYTEIIQFSLQQALNFSPLKLHYQKFAVRSKPMAKLSVLKLITDIFLEKSEFDLKVSGKVTNYISIPSFFLNRLKDTFGAANSTNSILSDFISSLFMLYQDKAPFSIISCKMLQLFDPTPVTNYEAPAMIQLFANLQRTWAVSTEYTESSLTFGEFKLNEVLTVLRDTFALDTSIYRYIVKSIEIPGAEKSQVNVLKAMHEIFKINYKMNHRKTSEEPEVTKWIDKELLEEIERSMGVEFYSSMTKQGFENQCAGIKINGADLLCAVLDGMLGIRSDQLSNAKKYFGAGAILTLEDFSQSLKRIREEIGDEDIKRLYLSAGNKSENFNGVDHITFYDTLNSNKFPGFCVPISAKEEESKNLEEQERKGSEERKATDFARIPSISTSTEEKLIKKKVTKKKQGKN